MPPTEYERRFWLLALEDPEQFRHLVANYLERVAEALKQAGLVSSSPSIGDACEPS